MIKKLENFFNNHNISSHTFAAIAASLVGLYMEDQQVRDQINIMLQHHPAILSGIGLAVVVYRNYASPRNRNAMERRSDPPQEKAQ